MSEKLRLYGILFVLLTIGFNLVNALAIKSTEGFLEENAYKIALMHYMIYKQDASHRGDEHFQVGADTHRYRIYEFGSQSGLDSSVIIGVNKEFFQERLKALVYRLFMIEFFLIASIVLLFQLMFERYTRKIREHQEWQRMLILGLNHRLGNFLSVHKLNTAILRSFLGDDERIIRMERSLEKATADFSIFVNLLKTDSKPKPKLLNIKPYLEATINLFEEELQGKRLRLSLKDLSVRMEEADLKDLLYNLVGNAIKHSSRNISIKTLKNRGRVILAIVNDISSTKSSGMGLGLMLVQNILKRYRYEMKLKVKRRYSVFVSFKL
ncbi:MAG: hypothetical protein NZL90_01050 [Aquificaceae bacterium]|nr:hypothetical protein [Aquificaceae bacterium]MDW8237120.1 hypothetical protein [Aquificaceae bacterium]